MRFPGLRIIGYIAIAAPLLFVTLWISSATIDGSWQFGVNSLSDMGISDNAVSAFLFNFGCMVTGILGMIAGAGMIVYGKKTLKVGGGMYIIGMLFMMERKIFGWIVLAIGIAIILASVFLTTHLYWKTTSAYTFIFMFGLTAAGAGLVIKQLFKK